MSETLRKTWGWGIFAFVLLVLLTLSIATASSAQGKAPQEEAIGMSPIVFFLACLIFSLFIGVIAMIAGVGGGVVFTPIMMGFTHIDSYIIRATGLLIAMSGALVGGGAYLRRGLANIRLLLYGAVPYMICAVIGALLAGYIKEVLGITGEAAVRAALGILVIGIACLFIFFGKRVEYPEVKHSDSFTERLSLSMSYWEESLGRVVDYKVKRAHIGAALLCGVGLISGLFGLGAGWAIVPVLNLVMLAPLKVAAASSIVMIGLGDSAAVWPYIMGGGIFPLFAVPCQIGLISGALIGARIMLKIKAGFVRWIVILVMLLAGIRLIMRAIELLT